MLVKIPACVLIWPIAGFLEDTTRGLKVSLLPFPYRHLWGYFQSSSHTCLGWAWSLEEGGSITAALLNPQPHPSPDLAGHFLKAGGLSWAGCHLLSQRCSKQPQKQVGMVEPQRIFCSFLKAEVEQVTHCSGQRANDQWPLTYWLGLRESMQLPDSRVGLKGGTTYVLRSLE